jgi:hypothetical protein
MGEVMFRGAPLAAYHDQQYRFDYAPDASGAMRVTGSSKLAADLLASEHGDGARKLLLSIEAATSKHAGVHPKGLILSNDESAFGAAIIEGRLNDPNFAAKEGAALLGDVEPAKGLAYEAAAATRNGVIMIDDRRTKGLRLLMQGTPAENVAMAPELPHLFAHEAGHLDPGSVLDPASPRVMEEGYVDFRARGSEALSSMAEALGIHDVQLQVPDGFKANADAFTKTLELAGHDVSTPAALDELRANMQGADLGAILHDSASRILSAHGLPATEDTAMDLALGFADSASVRDVLASVAKAGIKLA